MGVGDSAAAAGIGAARVRNKVAPYRNCARFHAGRKFCNAAASGSSTILVGSTLVEQRMLHLKILCR